MKILLPGATGKTGLHIIEEALKRGHRISAIASCTGKLKNYDIEKVERIINGSEAVINNLNVSGKSDNPEILHPAKQKIITNLAS